jgi:hypothetical protein
LRGMLTWWKSMVLQNGKKKQEEHPSR